MTLPEASRISNRGFAVGLRSVLEIVVDHRSRRRILPRCLRRMSLRAGSRLNAVRRRRRVKECIFLRDLVRVLPQRRDIIENPERASMGRNHQIVVLDDQIVHRRRRQIQLKRLPLRPIVERHVHPGLSPRIKQPALFRILAHHAHESIVWNSLRQLRPRLAVVAGLVNVGMQIVELMPISRHVGRPRIMRRRINLADAAPLRHILRSDVRPRLRLRLASTG